jgi:hypothetical protein
LPEAIYSLIFLGVPTSASLLSRRAQITFCSMAKQ